ncbi:Oxysterol-binding protein-domain-containing protein [Gloeopeniophorella convolvens]|nr:Oxysterol-binding protein-domain-containing protein [Gloeopeniophorella convolvens]
MSPGASSSEPLYQVKLLAALRSGNPSLIHPFLAEIGRERRKSREGAADPGAAALHLAIRCASIDTVSLLLSHRSISPNAVHPPTSGTTALHLAASLGRADVVCLFLEQEAIDDTLRDSNGKTCVDVARGKDVLRVINDSRSFLTASYRSLLRTYTLSARNAPPPPSLATKRKDIRLVELAVRAGADVFVRDRKGRPVQEVVGKDDKMRVFLRQFANNDTTLIDDGPLSGPPTLKGYLNKYTNVARGYGTRWFVLKDGVLSYYRHQEDEQVASRGSIAMKTAVLRPPSGAEKLRFEVHSTPSRGHSNVQKWFMKANHPVEAARWTQAISKAIDYAKQGFRSNESDTSSISKYSGRGSVSSTLSVPQIPKKDRDAESVNSMVPTDDEGGQSPMVRSRGDSSPPDQGKDDGQDASSGNDSSDRLYESDHPPHESSFELHGNSTAAQLEFTTQLLADLSAPTTTVASAVELSGALKDSLLSMQSMLNEYFLMIKERDDWWRARLSREQARQTVWEQSLQSVVKEGEALERELRRHSRRHSRIDTTASIEALGTLKARPSTLPLSPQLEEGEFDLQDFAPPTAVPRAPSEQRRTSMDSARASVGPGATLGRVLSTTPTVARRISMQRSPSAIPIAPLRSSDDEDIADTDEEDEFFDAIESNALPNLVVNEALAGNVERLVPNDAKKDQYEGYKVIRTSLDLKSDNRPPTSLWSVLKHSIGKDLTRISFPVFFNEPTSMLQRMAEDMEFSECLDAAQGERDPLRRIAFVAAFAMSNYSSTIGRIAKPFNPMLSETFEYVRLDKEYRYVSEQVSHHPPISACWAEGPRWRYYGEVDAQNKFTGKSFEIRPTGVANADLLLPAEWGPSYPKFMSKFTGSPLAVEHYSWKKVTTNVSGFILGSPTIDHYGDMVITNHRTGDQCVLTFKPRGWRGKDAYEISGYVADAQGTVAYEIAGRWNSQLIMRPMGTGTGSLNPDAAAHGAGSPLPSPSAPEHILLWRNSDKPPDAPFNLTPFAISLNACPRETLRPYVAPTDCRLRPDQRAFELGRYEHANALKGKQEERQRATRRARDEGRAPAHRPRWFAAETDGDTGERVWAPVRVGEEVAYWVERERAYRSRGKDAWAEVERIFIEDEP